MGQPVTVVNKTSNRKEILSFELNRSITGMGHRNYLFEELAESSELEATNELTTTIEDRDRDIADFVALELFKKYGTKDIKSVHLNSNVITLEATPNSTVAPQDISTFLEELFLYYPTK